jgi:hypothetical protein
MVLGIDGWYNGGVRAQVRIEDRDLVLTTVEKNDRLIAAIEACEEYEVWQWEALRTYTVSVNDPNPDKVHDVLDACAAIGIVLG